VKQITETDRQTTCALNSLTEVWELNGFSFNFDKKHVHHEMALKRLEILGKYSVAGRVLLLPISGNGDINITLGNCPSDGTDNTRARRAFRDATNRFYQGAFFTSKAIGLRKEATEEGTQAEGV